MEIIRTTAPKQKTPEDQLGFGRVFSDHMFIMEYIDGQWTNKRIQPYGNLSISPAANILHYAQEVFEGLKAYHAEDGRILLFRAKDNFARMNVSAARLCLPQLDEQEIYETLIELLKIEASWLPTRAGTSLYIRPNLFGNDDYIGVSAAKKCMFYIMLSPSGAYYATGLAPVKIYVEDAYVRAVKGGVGFAKTGGNYAASLIAGEEAHKRGFNQVLWLDGIERKYIEEVGAMNMFFLFKNELATPELQGSILDGITRRSIITLAEEMGVKTSQRKITMQEVYDAAKSGDLLEAFGTGTAAVVSPVGEFYWKGEQFSIGDGNIGAFTQKLYDTLTGIQYGRIPDTHGWVTEVK